VSKSVFFADEESANGFARRLDKLLGYPRQGQRADGGAVPPGTGITRAWTEPLVDEKTSQYRVPVTGIEQVPALQTYRSRLPVVEAIEVDNAMRRARDDSPDLEIPDVRR